MAPDFQLQTADGKTHQLNKMKGSIIFLIAGNRKLRKDDNRWGKAIMADFRQVIENKNVVSPTFRCYIIGNMEDVPKFISRQFIKTQLLKKPPPVPLLLDWEGKVHKLYKTKCKQKKKPALYLIDQQGEIVFHQYRKFDRQKYQKVRERITNLLVESNY